MAEHPSEEHLSCADTPSRKLKDRDCLGYVVLAFIVQQRTREIGIRMALGARAKDIVELIAASNGRALLGGLVVGFIGLAVGSKLIQSYLYGVSRYDFAAYVGVALLLAIAGLVATFWPAKRAITVDPAAALRHN